MDVGADGVKTGDTTESGFGLVGSAVQGSERLIVVVNGLKTARERANEAYKLLSWGFRSFEPRELFKPGEVIGTARVFGGNETEVPLVADGPVTLMAPRGASEKLSGKIAYTGPIQAPVAKGAEVARLEISGEGGQILSLPLKTAEAVPVGSLPQRAFDAALELGASAIRSGFGKP